MPSANVLNLQGAVQGSVDVPEAFGEEVREDLIRRAVIAEATRRLQPQGHFPLAGMQTTARYYGAMSSYRTGRHMGVATRPRQKLAGGRQGDVRRIPSSVKGKRAHPHVVEKTLVERINRREYQKAVMSSIAATAKPEYVRKAHAVADLHLPLIVSNEIESTKKTKDLVAILERLKLAEDLGRSAKARVRKGQRRLSAQRHYRKSVLIVVGEDKGLLRAARNIPGVDACLLNGLSAALLAPGGVPGRVTIWSEAAIKNMDAETANLSL